MAWTPSEDLTSVFSGPFLVGTGAAGSEASVGEIRDLNLQVWYETADVTAGSFYGTATVIDQVFTGVRATASFMLMQNWGDKTQADPARVFPGSTLSAGPTSKTMTLDVGTISGTLATDYDARWVFHKYSVSDLSDTTSDITFPAAIVYPAPEEFSLTGEDGAVMIPCTLIAFPDASQDLVIVGKNAS